MHSMGPSEGNGAAEGMRNDRWRLMGTSMKQRAAVNAEGHGLLRRGTRGVRLVLRSDISKRYILTKYISIRYISIKCISKRCIFRRYMPAKYIPAKYMPARYIPKRYIFKKYISAKYIFIRYITDKISKQTNKFS